MGVGSRVAERPKSNVLKKPDVLVDVVVLGDTSVGILEGRSGPSVCPVTVVKEAFIEDKDVDARDGRKVDEVPI